MSKIPMGSRGRARMTIRYAQVIEQDTSERIGSSAVFRQGTASAVPEYKRFRGFNP
jgi:hypothetical protein